MQLLDWMETWEEVKFTFPRVAIKYESTAEYELHMITDASKDGMGIAIYLKATYDNGKVAVNLIFAKSLITGPKLKDRMPRAELQAVERSKRTRLKISEIENLEGWNF